MPDVVFSVDQSKSMRDQAVPGHNRWHPDNPSAAFVQPGSEFRVECREWTNAQLGNNDSANDQVSINYDQEALENAAADVSNTAQDVGGAIANDVGETVDKVQNTDVDVDVDTNTADGNAQ